MATGDELILVDENAGIDWGNWATPDGSILTQAMLNTMYNNIISTRRMPNRTSWVFPDIHEKYKEEKKPEIKRGNPWVQ